MKNKINAIIFLTAFTFACESTQYSEENDGLQANSIDTTNFKEKEKKIDPKPAISPITEDQFRAMSKKFDAPAPFRKLLLTEKRDSLQTKIDTIELTYMAYACDCPQWMMKGHQTYDPDAHYFSFYPEAAHGSLKIPDSLHVAGNKITFIGREYTGFRFPENPRFMDPHPPKGRVLRYYAYDIKRPFTYWKNLR